MQIHGQRPRPRVAIIGEFSKQEDEELSALFPTVWRAQSVGHLTGRVHFSELDLLIVGQSINRLGQYDGLHVICFSTTIQSLPGPDPESLIAPASPAEKEGFYLPDQPLPLNRVREDDFRGVNSARGWLRIELVANALSAKESVTEGTIAASTDDDLPLAVHYVRSHDRKGLAWLPNKRFNRLSWIKALVEWWAPVDPIAFVHIGDWARHPKWQTKNELSLKEKIESLTEEKERLVQQLDIVIRRTEEELKNESVRADKEIRKLLTAQGEDLVQEVATTFREFGFDVTLVDDSLEAGRPKREDLRLRLPGRDPQWEAIVEVRGYRRSAGMTADLQRLDRFATFYRNEKGREPSVRIYAVNGQFELSPDQREVPLRSAAEDIQVFSEADGLIMPTIDLFQARRLLEVGDISKIQDSILDSRGLWSPPRE